MKVLAFIILLVCSCGCVSAETEAPAAEVLPTIVGALQVGLAAPDVEVLPAIGVGAPEAELQGPAAEALTDVPGAAPQPEVELKGPPAEALPLLINLSPLAPPPPPPSPLSFPPPPLPLIPGGCPGVVMALRVDNYTIDTFGPAQVDEFCNAVKTSAAWPYTVCVVTSVANYPSPTAGVVISSYIIFEVLNTSNLTSDIITAGYYRNLLLNNLNQTTLLSTIFGGLNSTVQLMDECSSYAGINPGYVCSTTAAACSLGGRGCFVDSDGKEYLEFLMADSFTCSARDASRFSPPEGEGGRDRNSTSPSPPPPSPQSPPPPVTPSVCTYIGTYRLQPIACPGKYLAVFPSCADKSVGLRSSTQAPGARIRWNLNTTAVDKVGVPAPIASLRSCPSSAVYLTSPSGTRQPSLGGGSWRFQVVPSSSTCGTVSIIANSRLSSNPTAPFLAVSPSCDSFVWSSSGDDTNAAFKVIRV